MVIENKLFEVWMGGGDKATKRRLARSPASIPAASASPREWGSTREAGDRAPRPCHALIAAASIRNRVPFRLAC